MLLESHRHTAEDLRLWRNLEMADRVNYGLRRVGQKANAARIAIAEFCDQTDGYASVSWGKDSVVLAHLLRDAAPWFPLVNLRCSNRNPNCDAVRDRYLSDFPGQDYHEIIVDYGDLHERLIGEELNKATDNLFFAGFKEAVSRFGKYRLSGIRAQESGSRAIRMFRWGHSSKFACAPIGWWHTADVFAYLVYHNLPIHPAYAMLGGGRWPREHLRVAEIGDTHGTGMGRQLWEREFYPEFWDERAHSH